MDLDSYLRKAELTNAGFGALVGLSATSVWKIRYARMDPSLRTMLAIERATGGWVKAADFVLQAARTDDAA